MSSHTPNQKPPASAFRSLTETRGEWTVRVSGPRVVLRGSMFPNMMRFRDGSILINAASDEEHSPRIMIRSQDDGQTWKPLAGQYNFSAPGLFSVSNETTASLKVEVTPLADEPGWYAAQRWEMRDHGQSFTGPTEGVRLFLPPEEFAPRALQYFHGNIVELSDGSLLTVMQGVVGTEQRIYPWRVFTARSTDGGMTWKYVSTVADLESIDDPGGVIECGYRLHGPCEPNIQHLGDDRLICVMRLVNDDWEPPLAPPAESYHDLSYTIPTDGFCAHSRSEPLPENQYYTLGPPSVPLIVSYSSDAGQTWTPAKPMRQARGCYPRMAQSRELLALVYGGLTFPRWGNCITFSTDGGHTWADEVNFAPFLTTGYADIVPAGPGQFLCAFDCTPPQPWKDHKAHWVGVVDISIQRT